MLKNINLILALIILSATALAATEPKEVRVGGYLFPPFIQIEGQTVTGLTIGILELLNEQQTDFHFSFVPTSPKRRYNDFKRGMFDIIFFENIEWGWKKYNLLASDVFLSGGEVFFSLNKKGITQTYFTDLRDKSIVAILGYHYSFANNETDANLLRHQFNIKLVNSPKTVINQVLNGKADLGIATYSYLKDQIKINPILNDKLFISEQFDQTYQHRVLLRNNGPISSDDMNRLLDQIQNNGTLVKLLAKYGLTPLR